MSPVARAPRVCMFAEFLYPVVSGGRIPFAGGIEVQLSNLGRGLVQRGFDVRIVTCDYGQPDPFPVDGLMLHKSYPPAGGIPVLRFFHPRLTRGIAALWKLDADIYLFQGASLWAGIVEAVAHARGRRFVWLAGHDHDVQTALPDVHGPRDRWMVRRALRGADSIVTQTRHQQKLLREQFGLDSTVIMNPVELPELASLPEPGAAKQLVWLSTYKPVKRPEWFTRFAERHPAVPCRMAGVVLDTAEGAAVFQGARAVAARCPNLTVEGTVPHERIGEVLAGAAVFAHSSWSEGFPNTLLEAWARRVPTVTAFDPDGIVERERLGAHRTDYDTWEEALERLLAEPELRRECGARARAWAEAQHAPDVIRDAMAAVLRTQLAR